MRESKQSHLSISRVLREIKVQKQKKTNKNNYLGKQNSMLPLGKMLRTDILLTDFHLPTRTSKTSPSTILRN